MPIHTVDRIVSLFNGELNNKKILLCGISYRQDIGDTRYSPSEILYKELRERKASIVCHDPHLTYWEEVEIEIMDKLPSRADFDAIIFAVPHIEYKKLDLINWLKKDVIVLDANMVFDDMTRKKYKVKVFGLKA